MTKITEPSSGGTNSGNASFRLGRLEQFAPRLLILLVLSWVAVCFIASYFKYETFGQGYDQVDFEQAIWNTTQGHTMEDSRFNFTDSVFGMDWMPMLLFFVPAYALLPSAHTLFFLQIFASALGAIPIFWLARDRLASQTAGLAAASIYLLFPTLLHTALNPFQVRLFAVSLLLFALYFFEKGNWKLFLAFAILGMTARTDVALVVGMFGFYGLTGRKSWHFSVPPMVIGFGYFALSTFIIVPSFAHPGALSGGSGTLTDPMACWPCGHNPMLAYYGHLGATGPEIIKNIVTRPLDTLGLMFAAPKIYYMLSLLVPVLFLPLLAPRPLLLGLPILVLNLLSTRQSQFNYQFHYSLLLIPGLVVASIYGAERLACLKLWQRLSFRPRFRRRTVTSLAALSAIAYASLLSIPYKNPIVRTFLYHESAARVKAARTLVAMIPPEARVAASSKLAPRLLPRRYVYNFPPAPYSPYNFGDRQSPAFANLDYVLVDPAASALEYETNKIAGKSGLSVLRDLPEWTLIADNQGLLLYRHK